MKIKRNFTILCLDCRRKNFKKSKQQHFEEQLLLHLLAIQNKQWTDSLHCNLFQKYACTLVTTTLHFLLVQIYMKLDTV